MKRTKEDYLNLLEETVKYYSEDTNRRAIDSNNGCFYYDVSTGNKCAVGRCLIKPEDKDSKLKDKNGNSDSDVVSLLVLFNNSIFKPEYRGFDVSFWDKLQRLHDENKYWNTNGLSSYGKFEADNIKKLIAQGKFH